MEGRLYSSKNNMDPGPVPLELQGLTQVEELLISPVMPIMNVYRLLHGQLSSAIVAMLPQDFVCHAYNLAETQLSVKL